MAVTTSKPSKVGNNYYKTSVTTNADGSLSSTTFRTDAKGNNPVSVQTTSVDKNGGNRTTSFGTGATAAEKKAFNDPNSPESKARKQQVQSQNPYGSAPTEEEQKKTNAAGGGSGNTATKPEEGKDQGSQLAEQDAKTQKAGTRDSFRKDLVYPVTLKLEYQDVIKFNMLKFRPRAFQSGGDLNAVGDRPSGDIIGTVVLPIPAGISDQNSCNWGQDEMTPIAAELANLAKTGITQGGSAMAAAAGQTAQSVADNSGEVQNLVVGKFVEAATGTQNFLSRTQGRVVNPNMELLFLGPSLRSFAFTFKFSAREKDESVRIRDIIRFFKQGMAPIRTEAQLFLKAPHTFQIQYLHKNNPHKFLNKFKECALKDCSVQYTPVGEYATFHDGAMVSYSMTLQFQELEPVFNDEYTLQDGDIGF